MQTECIPDIFGFEAVEGRQVVAAFDGGAITSDAGALLLGATDRAIGMVDRLASCFADRRSQAHVEHSVATLVGQRIFAIALGYEDINDHETLRRANIDASAGSIEEVARIVARIRERWPEVRVLLRADSGFTRDGLMSWCEQNDVDYLFGLAKNDRLIAEIAAELAEAAEENRI